MRDGYSLDRRGSTQGLLIFDVFHGFLMRNERHLSLLELFLAPFEISLTIFDFSGFLSKLLFLAVHGENCTLECFWVVLSELAEDEVNLRPYITRLVIECLEETLVREVDPLEGFNAIIQDTSNCVESRF